MKAELIEKYTSLVRDKFDPISIRKISDEKVVWLYEGERIAVLENNKFYFEDKLSELFKKKGG